MEQKIHTPSLMIMSLIQEQTKGLYKIISVFQFANMLYHSLKKTISLNNNHKAKSHYIKSIEEQKMKYLKILYTLKSLFVVLRRKIWKFIYILF